MRIASLLLLLLFISLIVHSQIPSNAVAPEDAAFNAAYSTRKVPVVTGKLLNISATELKALPIIYTITTPFSEFQQTKSAFAKPDGSFRLELDNALPYQRIWISVGKVFYTGIYANADLYLQLDMKKLKAAKGVNSNGDGVSYLGTDGLLNVYMNNYILYGRSDHNRLWAEISDLVIYEHKNTDSVVRQYNMLSDSLRKIEEDYIAENPSPFGWILENERMTEYYEQLCMMYFGKTMDDALWQKIKQHKSYFVSSSSTNFYRYATMYIGMLPISKLVTNWQEVADLPDLDNTEKAIVDSLKNSDKMQPAYPYTPENIKKWTKILRPRVQKIMFLRSLDKNIQIIDSIFPPAKADFLKLGLFTSKDLNDQKIGLEHILQSMHTGWCINVLNKEYKKTTDKADEINKALATKSAGNANTSFGRPLLKTSFGATMYKASAIKALDFLAKIKTSFPGKAIIIDRWATWCGPCLAEMPHSRELQESSKDLPVVFIYLCTIVNSTELKWKTKVMELKQPGIHILIDETLDADLSTYFAFNGYPGYAFINKAGIYRPGALNRPSEIPNRVALAALINK